MAKRAKKEEFDVDAAMKAATEGNGKSNGKKSDIRTHEVPSNKAELRKWIQAHAKVKTGEAEKAAAARILVPIGQRFRKEDSKNDGKLHASVKLSADDDVVTITQSASFSSVDQKFKDEIKDACKEYEIDYDNYFESTPKISLKKDLDPETRSNVIKTLFKSFGKDFATFFDLAYPISVKSEAFARDSILQPNVAKLADSIGPESKAAIIKQNSPSIKLG